MEKLAKISFLLVGGFVILLFYGVGSLSAQNHQTPLISCLEVHADGDVTISWSSVDSDVLQQNIFYSANGSNYIQVGQVSTYDPNISSYTHLGADAQVAIRYYKVEVVYPTETVESAAGRTMSLSAQPNIQDPGIIELTWNDMSLEVFPYQVWQEWPAGTWAMIAEGVTRTLYNDTLQNAICDDLVTYLIKVENPLGCTSISSLAGGRYSETRIPEPPVFDSLTVNDQGFVVLSWSPSASSDVESTIVYRNNFPVAEIPVVGSVQQFVDLDADPCSDPNLVYALAAADFCGNKSPIEDDRKLSPIFLEMPVGSVCESNVTLRWSPYINASPELTGYQVTYSLNGLPFIVAGEVDKSTLSFVHQNVVADADYTYAIRALFGDATSTSCQKLISTGSYIIPDSVYLANATVRPDHIIELKLDVDLNPLTCSWEVYRSDATSAETLIFTFNRDQVAGSPFVFSDSTADPATKPYTYEVAVVDSCGHDRLSSNALTTIFLSGKKTGEQEYLLDWTPFSGWDADVSYYRIYRDAHSGEPTIPIDSVNSSTLQYLDNLTNVVLPNGLATYWVEAVENATGVDISEISQSNRVTLSRDSDLFMPNAFRPRGVTPSFKPVFSYFNGPTYLFQIYNRWGQLIFETSQPDNGWDGTFRSVDSPMGTYLYRLVYTTSEGVQNQKNGSFTLVK